MHLKNVSFTRGMRVRSRRKYAGEYLVRVRDIRYKSVVRMHNSSETHPRHGNSELTWIWSGERIHRAPTPPRRRVCPIRIMKPRTCGISRRALFDYYIGRIPNFSYISSPCPPRIDAPENSPLPPVSGIRPVNIDLRPLDRI